jgi:hypothetical protein
VKAGASRCRWIRVRVCFFPTRWDRYFQPTMSVLDVYHYGTQHYEHHHRQLTF